MTASFAGAQVNVRSDVTISCCCQPSCDASVDLAPGTCPQIDSTGGRAVVGRWPARFSSQDRVKLVFRPKALIIMREKSMAERSADLRPRGGICCGRRRRRQR